MKGYIHVYTGNGKGKTTAAFGLALRAAGAGMKVFIGQFIKGKPYYENELINKKLDNITVVQYGRGCFITGDPTDEDYKAARNGFSEIKKIIIENKFDVLIWDEVNIALYYNLFEVDELIDVLDKKPEKMEIILTGRYAPQKLIEYADLVTEMKEIKHYFNKGIEARKGIEY